MDPMFNLLWQQYRTWADTSRQLKDQNASWKRRVLIMTIVEQGVSGDLRRDAHAGRKRGVARRDGDHEDVAPFVILPASRQSGGEATSSC